MEKVNAIGRRKAAVARVYLTEGTGKITIDKRPLDVYFPSSILQYLDAKHNNILTFRELEAFACFGTSRFLTLYGARVACYEAFRTESGFVFGIDLHQSAGDGETKSLGLSFVTAAVEVGVDVVFATQAIPADSVHSHPPT